MIFLQNISKKKLLIIISLLAVVIAIPLTVFIAQKQQEIRQGAAGKETMVFFADLGSTSPTALSQIFLSPNQQKILALYLDTDSIPINGYQIIVSFGSLLPYVNIREIEEGADANQFGSLVFKDFDQTTGKIRFAKTTPPDSSSIIQGKLHLGSIAFSVKDNASGNGSINVSWAEITSFGRDNPTVDLSSLPFTIGSTAAPQASPAAAPADSNLVPCPTGALIQCSSQMPNIPGASFEKVPNTTCSAGQTCYRRVSALLPTSVVSPTPTPTLPPATQQPPAAAQPPPAAQPTLTPQRKQQVINAIFSQLEEQLRLVGAPDYYRFRKSDDLITRIAIGRGGKNYIWTSSGGETNNLGELGSTITKGDKVFILFSNGVNNSFDKFGNVSTGGKPKIFLEGCRSEESCSYLLPTSLPLFDPCPFDDDCNFTQQYWLIITSWPLGAAVPPPTPTPTSTPIDAGIRGGGGGGGGAAPGQQSPFATPLPTLAPGTTRFILGFTLEAIGLDPGSPKRNLEQRATIKLFRNTDPQPLFTLAPVSLTYNFDQQNQAGRYGGIVDLQTSLRPGTYKILVQIPGYLQRFQTLGEITSGGTAGQTLPVNISVPLVAGDVNGDNRIDALDYGIIQSCFGGRATTGRCTFKTPSGAPFADINDDGKVDGVDIILYLKNFGKTGDQ